MTQLAVALLLPPDASEVIDEVRNRYGSPRARSVVPHITLVYPFVPSVPPTSVVERLIDVARETAPFVITLRQFRHFDKPVRLVYLCPSDNGEIGRLHRAVSDVVSCMSESRPSHFDDNDFVPHISINDDVTEEQLPDFMKRLEFVRLDLRPKIDRFCLFQNEGDAWKMFQTLDFASR